MIDEIVVLCGGRGTRIASLYGDIPKPMIPINGVPFLAILVNQLKKNGFKKIILSAGYMGDYIDSYFKKSNIDGIEVVVEIENELLGTGGAIKNCLKYLKKNSFFVINGDTFIEFSRDNMEIEFNNQDKNGLLLVSKIENDKDYGLVSFDHDSRLLSFNRKTKLGNYAFAGVYVLNRLAFKKTIDRKFNLDEFIGRLLDVFVYKTESPFLI